MWVFIGVITALTVIYFLLYELPIILMHRDLKKEDPRFLMLTAHLHCGINRKGKETSKIVL